MKKTIQRVLAAVILFAMILSGGFSEVGKVHAEKQQGTTKRAIYVVFDNSGSMYGDGNKAWSQATYAMEVFAAMMNYESGDVMKVFPMHDITTDGNTGSATKSSMEIRGKDDIAQIHNMYTPKPGGTPYTQVNNAAGELTKLLNAGSVDEGWLVVLTDGDFDNDIPASGLKADLEGKAAANENLYVQYLAIGMDVKNIPEGNADKGLYAQKAGNTSEVVNELAEISNRIFKRNEYAGYSSEDSGLEFDIPLALLYDRSSNLNAVPFPADQNYGVDIRIPSIFIKCRDKSLYESVQSIDCSYISCAERDFPSYFEQDMEV